MQILITTLFLGVKDGGAFFGVFVTVTLTYFCLIEMSNE